MWRPEDWINPYRKAGVGFGDDVTWDICEGKQRKAFEEGADAILEALREWVFYSDSKEQIND